MSDSGDAPPANTLQPSSRHSQEIHLMAKPVGPACNLRCQYCFYLEKEALFPSRQTYRMSDEVLEAYVGAVAHANMNSGSEMLYTWQGGEPLLAGLEFYRKAFELQRRYAQGRKVSNTLQTNGTLLTDKWCEFLASNGVLVGLSLDGPEFVHDHHRVDSNGNGTFSKVLNGLNLLRKHGVSFNVLACVTKHAARYPLETYRFFKEQRVEFVQFSPIVERMPNDAAQSLGLSLAMPPSLDREESAEVAPWTVAPDTYADFMIAIFDEWVRNDVGKTFVMNFEWLINACVGGQAAICTMGRRCGNCCIVEQNGDIYSCDHFVYPEYRLGNVLTDDVRRLVESPKQTAWGARKEDALPAACGDCEVAFICRGGCPKHRFAQSRYGESGLNYLCSGYRKFYSHTAKYMKAFQALLELDVPLESIMDAIGKPLAIPASDKTGGRPAAIWIE